MSLATRNAIAVRATATAAMAAAALTPKTHLGGAAQALGRAHEPLVGGAHLSRHVLFD